MAISEKLLFSKITLFRINLKVNIFVVVEPRTRRTGSEQNKGSLPTTTKKEQKII